MILEKHYAIVIKNAIEEYLKPKDSRVREAR
jgi:hypothetical protein